MSDHPAYKAVGELLDQSRVGIEMVVGVRNTLEHPGHSAGTVEIANFKAMAGGVRFPIFKFSGKAVEYGVAQSMKEIHEMLLVLAESVVVFGVMTKFVSGDIGVFHVKDSDRDKSTPKAWKLVRVTSDMKGTAKPYDGKRPAA